MSAEFIALAGTAASIGFFHTLLGPDHYLPFVAMSKARGWSRVKTAWITFLCGVGHVASSVVLGLVGVAFGLALARLKLAESFRGEIAGWLLTSFGLLYLIWGLRRAIRGHSHTHSHEHADVVAHAHEHTHSDRHLHVHDRKSARSITPWVLFTIFVFGPCEPLIPILMYPAAKSSLWGLGLITTIFAVTTIGTMLVVVMLAVSGLRFVRVGKLERYSHALAGATVLLCGLAIQFGL